MKELEIDFFFSFRSPWSYFAVPRLLDLQRNYAIKVNLRVVNPLFIRNHAFFEHLPEKWMTYLFTDLLRHSEYLNIPIGLPRPDPIDQSLTADSADHLVLALNPLGIAAEHLGCGLEFAKEVSAIIWDGQTDGWNSGDHLSDAAQRAGLALDDIHHWVKENTEQWPQLLESNNQTLAEYHWGVPTMVFKDEPFFGQDKIDLLIWRLKQNGLQPRGQK